MFSKSYKLKGSCVKTFLWHDSLMSDVNKVGPAVVNVAEQPAAITDWANKLLVNLMASLLTV